MGSRSNSTPFLLFSQQAMNNLKHSLSAKRALEAHARGSMVTVPSSLEARAEIVMNQNLLMRCLQRPSGHSPLGSPEQPHPTPAFSGPGRPWHSPTSATPSPPDLQPKARSCRRLGAERVGQVLGSQQEGRERRGGVRSIQGQRRYVQEDMQAPPQSHQGGRLQNSQSFLTSEPEGP